MRAAALVLACLLALPAASAARVERSRAERASFAWHHPCPATGKRYGACHGWIVDHVIPLCGGGEDRPSNMQWQTIADAAAKDRREVAWCKCLDRHPRTACPFPEADRARPVSP